MAFKINPERVINVTCQVTSAAAPIFSLGPLGIPLGIVSAAGLELAMVNTRSAHANVRFNGRLMVWAVRIFVCILEQMAYQAVAIFWVNGGEGRTLPLGLNAMYFAWAVVCFMALIDLGAYLSNSVKAAAVAADQEHAATLERADALERERHERKAAEEREKRAHEQELARIAAEAEKAKAEAAARAQAEAAKAQAAAQTEAAKVQAEAVKIKAEEDRKAAEVAAEAARKQAEERRKQAEATAEADRKRAEDERKRAEDARKVAEAAAEVKRRLAEEAEARRNAQLIEEQRVAQQRAEQQQREREAAEAADRKRQQEEAEARAASDAKRNRFLSASASEKWDIILKAEAQLTSALGRKPTQKQIADEAGTSERTVREYQAKFQRAAQAA